MSLTLGNYKSDLTLRGFNAVSNDAALTLAVNAGRRMLLGERRWAWLEALGTTTLVATVGQSDVSLSSVTDLLYLDAIRADYNNTGYDMMPIRLQELRDYLNSYRWNDIPQYWSSLDGAHPAKAFLLPRPDVPYNLTLDYVKDAADLAVDGDVDTVVPTAFRDAVVWGAAINLAYRRSDLDRLQMAQAQYNSEVQKRVRQEQMGQRQRSNQVRRSGQWDQYC